MKLYTAFAACVGIFLFHGAALAQGQKVSLSAENRSFEWFFLVADAAKERGIWARHGLDPELVPAAGSAAQLKQQVDAGLKLGWVNTAEVLLARAQGVPVKIVAGYLGDTIAKIYAGPSDPIRAAKDLDGKKVGILSNTHTSYRAVLYVNEKFGIKSEPIPLGNLANNVAALKAGKIEALYSAEGAALGYVDSGDLRIAVRLADVYPRPYTAVVAWATEATIKDDPQLVRAFVGATLESVRYLQANPAAASELYAKATRASKSLSDRAAAELNSLLSSSGRGSGDDLLAAVAGNWAFTRDSGSVPPGTTVKVEDAVDSRFLP